MSGEGSKESVWGSTVAQAIVKLMGAFFCRAISTCNKARESFPPDKPTKRISDD